MTVAVATKGLPLPGISVVVVMVTVGEAVTVMTDVTVLVGRLRHEHALVTSRVGYWVTPSGIGGRRGRFNGVGPAVQELMVVVL